MIFPNFFEAKNSLSLFGLEKEFKFLYQLYKKKKLPNVLLLNGKKGIGKSTLINHFLFSIFDEKNYNLEKKIISNESKIYNQFINNIFSNIIYIKGSDFKTVKVEDIRNLKTKIFQSTILEKERFIILDDVELFNKNSLNALLKIIEEPSKNNHFFLIYNNSAPLLDTIKSRALELRIILNEQNRIQIITDLMKHHNIQEVIDPNKSKLSPGNYLKFNHICGENNVMDANNLIIELSNLLNLYKKNKDMIFINIAFFVVDYYLLDLKKKNSLNSDKIYEIKNFINNNLNKFLVYNINQNTLIKAISEKLNND